MQFRLIKKVPVVEIDGKTCFLDTGFPGVTMPVREGAQKSFGIPGIQVAGVLSLKQYTKFDYPNCEVTTSDEIVAVMIGNTEITEYTQNEDGTRTWRTEFVVRGNPDETWDIILKDSFGRVSETFTQTIPDEYKPVIETEPDDAGIETEPDDAGEDSGEKKGSFFDMIYRFIQWLLNFIKSILSFFSALLD